MHLKSVVIYPEKFPTREYYPFNLSVFHETKRVSFDTPVTLFVGENGTGKSTLLQAIAHRCDIHIWRYRDAGGFDNNPYADKLQNCIGVEWAGGRVPGSFFGSAIFQHFAELLDEWAASDPRHLEYFGGKSLVTQSHGQSLMSFFRARYRIKGLYLLDEPETALSPKSQLELLDILTKMSAAGHAQFIVATHSPILLACPDAKIYSFDFAPVRSVRYEQTAHYQIYERFLREQTQLLKCEVA